MPHGHVVALEVLDHAQCVLRQTRRRGVQGDGQDDAGHVLAVRDSRVSLSAPPNIVLGALVLGACGRQFAGARVVAVALVPACKRVGRAVVHDIGRVRLRLRVPVVRRGLHERRVHGDVALISAAHLAGQEHPRSVQQGVRHRVRPLALDRVLLQHPGRLDLLALLHGQAPVQRCGLGVDQREQATVRVVGPVVGGFLRPGATGRVDAQGGQDLVRGLNQQFGDLLEQGRTPGQGQEQQQAQDLHLRQPRLRARTNPLTVLSPPGGEQVGQVRVLHDPRCRARVAQHPRLTTDRTLIRGEVQVPHPSQGRVVPGGGGVREGAGHDRCLRALPWRGAGTRGHPRGKAGGRTAGPSRWCGTSPTRRRTPAGPAGYPR